MCLEDGTARIVVFPRVNTFPRLGDSVASLEGRTRQQKCPV